MLTLKYILDGKEFMLVKLFHDYYEMYGNVIERAKTKPRFIMLITKIFIFLDTNVSILILKYVFSYILSFSIVCMMVNIK